MGWRPTRNGVARTISDSNFNQPERAMLMFDLSGFKSINDQHGHPADDQVLRSFASLLRTQLGHVPAGRLGGAALAAQIGADVAEASVCYSGVRIPMTVSIGIGAEKAAGSDLGAFLASADEALYRAKANGRNRVDQFHGLVWRRRGPVVAIG